MILADTSIWVDHLRTGDPALTALLNDGQVLAHPFVIGELALGGLRIRNAAMRDLEKLPSTDVATNDEVMALIERRELWRHGIGYVDAHLLAATALTSARLWTRDRGLDAAARDMGLGAGFA